MIRPGGGSWAGVRDSFGERATGVDAEGRSVDLLRLFDAFTPASRALADRIARLGVDRPAVGRALALERDEPSTRLILISEHVPGVRLSELLRTAGERSVVADLGAALFVMRRLLTLAESLKAATGLAHFSIAPERIVITPHGRVVIVEPVLAAAAETGATGSDDIAGIAIAGMSIMLGHLIEDAEHIDPLSPVLQDAADVAAIRAGDSFSTALRLWFDRAVIADPTLSFSDFRQARLALSRVELARESGCDASRRALKVFLNDLAIERLTDVDAAALESNRLREMRTKRRARWKAISAPDEEWFAVEHELLGDDSRVVEEQFQVVDLPGERADEAIGIGPLAEPGMAASVEATFEAALVEESLEAALLEEPTEAEPVEEPLGAALVEEPTEADPAPSPRSWFRTMARQLGLASAQPGPLGTELAAPPADVSLESPPAEQSTETMTDPVAANLEGAAESSTVSTEPVLEEARTESGDAGEERLAEVAAESWSAWTEPVSAETIAPRVDAGEERPADAVEEGPTRVVEAVRPVETIDQPLDEDEPIAPVDESIAAKLAEDAHTSWIQSITEQIGRMRRREEGLREPPAETTAAETDAASLVDHTETESPGEPRETVEEIEALFAEDAADTPAVEAAPIQLERAVMAHVEERTEPAAWATPEAALEEGESIEAVPVEEPLEAALVEEPTEADPAPSPRSWFRTMARRLGLASAEPRPIGTELAAPPADVPLESPPAEQSTETMTDPVAANLEGAAESSTVSTEPVLEEARTESGDAGEERLAEVAAESWSAWTEPVSSETIAPRVDAGEERPADAVEEGPTRVVEAVQPVETIDQPLDEDEPIAPADESIAAKLAEDAHKSWIQSITEQIGRMRRREEGLREPPAKTTAPATDATPLVDHTETESSGEPRETVEEIEALFAEDAADTPAVEAAPIQLERAAMAHVEERTEQPAARATPEPAPWRDDARAAGTAMRFPAELVDHEYAPHHGVLHERAADAQPHRADVQPGKGAPSPRTIVAPPRRWTRAAATILSAGLALAIVAALVIAGRSYYGSLSTPGTIAVDSTPRGSEVLVDGTARGITPLTLTLEPGDHVLALRRNGLTRQFPITVTPGAQLSRQLDWSTVRATGTLAIRSTPSQAKVSVDGKERGVTPLTVSNVPVGMRRIVIDSSAGTVRRDVRVVADSQVTINETIISGWIAAFAPFELQVYEGTRLLGTTEDGRIMVRPGHHELDFVNTRLGFRERRGIDVNPGATTAVNITTAVGIVRITAPAGADVLVDGVLFGDTPLRELRLPIGSHEIVLRHPQLGEQRVSITVGASAPTEVSVDFPKR